MKKAYLLFMALTFSMGVAACNDDTNDSTGFDTGLPTDKKLSDLSDDDVYKSCIASAEFTNEIISSPDLTCQIQALIFTGAAYSQAGDFMTDAIIVATCQTTYDACLDDPPQIDQDSPEEQCEDSTTGDIPDNCDATVGELEACTGDYAESIQVAVDEQLPACNDLDKTTMDELLELYQNTDTDSPNDPGAIEDLVEPPAPPASCIVANEKCPGFLDSLSASQPDLL
jgi:hypothetical protein